MSLRDRVARRAWQLGGGAAVIGAVVAAWVWIGGDRGGGADAARASASEVAADAAPAATLPPPPLPPPELGLARVDEVEPNDTAAGAQRLDPEGRAVEAVLEAGDADEYVLALDGERLLHAFTVGASGLRVRVFDGGGTEVAAATAPTPIRALLAKAGTWRVRIDAGESGSPGPYTLFVATRPASSELEKEPNGEPREALAAATAAIGPADLLAFRAEGWLTHADDTDCFAFPFKAPPGGSLARLSLRPPAAVVGRLHAFTPAGTELAAVRSPAPGEPAVMPALAARPWEPGLVACVDARGGASPHARYEVTVRVWAPDGPFEDEPNDTRARATGLPPGVRLRAYAPAGDIDWYRLSGGRDGRMRVVLDPPAEAVAEIALLDARGATLVEKRTEPGVAATLVANDVAFATVRVRAGATLDDTYQIEARRPLREAGGGP